MKFIDEFRDAELAKKLVAHINRISTKPIRLMEFCGGHTVAIMRNGLRQLLPSRIQMLSGPGCPVCVTANADIDRVIALAKLPDVIVTTFGDMLKVPGSYSSLQMARAEGADVRIVYSTQDALKIAHDNPSKYIVFIGIGFETTAPTIAAVVLEAQAKNIRNFKVLSLLKLCPPVIKAILDLGEVKLDGIIGPGHVSAVIGAQPYEFIPRDYGIAFVISGFEALDILLAVELLVEQVEKQQPRTEIAYKRGVKAEGNKTALDLMHRVFQTQGADWRGIGIVHDSGLNFRPEYASFAAETTFKIEPGLVNKAQGCICGEILRGIQTPFNCRLFRSVCTPENPIGPCMVSAEGACSAYYSYGEGNV